VLFMIEQNQHLESLKDIKQLMDKSSRFISLSGLSGVAAGVCALVAAWLAQRKLHESQPGAPEEYSSNGAGPLTLPIKGVALDLILIAAVTFVAALTFAFIFTYLRSRKTGVPIWGYTARRVMVNVFVPMITGGLVIVRMMQLGFYDLVAPLCLLFYGLALINASKYTLTEIRYLGYGQLILGILNLWLIPYSLYFWAAGFGVLHILYGIIMWNKYERNQ
jgi:hypothetical protein